MVLTSQEKETSRIPLLEKKLINLQTQLKSLALIPMTPMRTSSLKHISTTNDPTTSTKENLPPPRSTSHSSPRKPLSTRPPQQPSDLLIPKDSTESLLAESKRIFSSLHTENEKLRARLASLELVNADLQCSNRKRVDTLQNEIDLLGKKNRMLEVSLNKAQAESFALVTSPRVGRGGACTGGCCGGGEVERLAEELAWHAKLHLYAEKERLRLLDLLEFAGREGKVVSREYVGLREKLSKFSLRSQDSGIRCLV